MLHKRMPKIVKTIWLVINLRDVLMSGTPKNNYKNNISKKYYVLN